MRSALRWVRVLALLVGPFVAATESAALPSFARQTGFECVACHVSWPELTAVGRQFKLGGYTLITMGGAVATSDVVNAVLAESGSSFQVPAGLAGDIPVSATLHNFHASIGWRWLLADDHLVIRALLPDRVEQRRE